MKYKIKKIWVANKYGFLFLFFLILGTIVEQSNLSFESKGADAIAFNNKLLEEENKADETIDSLLLHSLTNNLPVWVNENSLKLDYLNKEHGLIFLVYRNDSLKYWTSNSLPIPEKPGELTRKFTKLGNSYVEVREKQSQSVTVVGLICIMESYSYENKFLKSGFYPIFNVDCNHSIIIDGENTANAIYNKEKDYLFGLNKESACNAILKIRVTIVLIFIAFCFLLLYGRDKFKNKNFSFSQIVLFSVTLIAIRVLVQVFRVPIFLNSLEVFQPQYFAFSEFFPSLGDLLLTVVLTTYIIFVFYTKVKLKSIVSLPKLKKGIVLIGWMFIFLIYARGAYQIFTHLIIDSNFQYEAYDVLNLSVFSFIGYFILLILFIGLVLLIDKACLQIKGSVKFKYLIAGVSILGVLILLISLALGRFHMIIPVIFTFSIIIYWLHVRLKYTPSFGMVVVLIAVFSAFSTDFIRKENFNKRIEESKVIAVNLAREQDPVAEVILGDIIEQIKTDTIIKNLLEDELFDFNHMADYIKQFYFAGYLDRYGFQLTICNDRDSVLLNENEQIWQYCYGFFDHLLRTDGVETTIPGLYYLKDLSGGLNYFMKSEINLSGNWSNVTLFFELSSRLNVEVLGYPELLLEKPVGLYAMHNTASYAKYENNRLINRFGDFPYALERDVYQKNQDEFSFFQAENYDHLLYNPHAEHTVIVSFPTVRFYNIIISFTYIFFFLLIQTTLLLIVGNRFTHIVDFHFSIKNKIVFSMMLILFISLFFVGGGTIMYTYNQYEKGQIDILSEKIQSVLVEMEHKLSHYHDIHDVSPEYVNSLLVKFSNVFYSDINLYDVQGNLVETSRKEIFERNLTGKNINAEAYRELVLNKKARIVHKESIGKMEYYSAYIPFINAENELLAYLNLPYFSKEVVLRKELLRVVVGVINIYAFLLVLSIIVAVYISNRLTEPLRMVQQRIKNVDLSKKNERIDYHGQDEIAELVVEYNRMLDELDKSAKMLAKSERESAWREMARQIAHEIKNPLTPMKLSIQLLSKSWQNKDEDFEQRFQRSTKTLIEQIDSLSSIATAFSQFARMPIARSEKVNLIERINRSAELFKECSYATLDMHLPADKEVFVRADNERMLQVFNNLVKNAIQAIPKDKNGKVIINLTQSDASVVVEISDNGVGVKPEMEDQLFQPNFTTKSSGTGLGLAIVKNIVEEFGGAIWFKSELGKGSSFFISMPVFIDRDKD